VTAPAPFATVSILGLGLMGGSLARALRRLPAPPRVVGWSPDVGESLEALGAAALDEVADTAEEAAGAADLVVYATPLGAVLELLERHRARWRADAVVTDVASLKAPVVERVGALGVASGYVGSHPMVGGEGSGFAASREGLFRDATVWLASGTGTDDARRRLEAFWRALGARPRWSDPREHDRLMVRASHVPQVLSSALALALERAGVPRAELGPGGRDMTRLAASSPGMWRDLLGRSADRLAPALREVCAALEEIAVLLESGAVDDVAGLMEEGKTWARAGDGGGGGAERAGGAAAGPDEAVGGS